MSAESWKRERRQLRRRGANARARILLSLGDPGADASPPLPRLLPPTPCPLLLPKPRLPHAPPHPADATAKTASIAATLKSASRDAGPRVEIREPKHLYLPQSPRSRAAAEAEQVSHRLLAHGHACMAVRQEHECMGMHGCGVEGPCLHHVT